MTSRLPKKQFERPPAQAVEEQDQRIGYVEPAIQSPSEVYALWAAPVKSKMLVRSNDKLWLIDAALWPGERRFSLPPDRLQPAPSWVELASKVTPEKVSELLLISGIIDAETLALQINLQHFYQNLMAAYAITLREQP